MTTEAVKRDSFGSFTICTGYEGKGGCFWCGGPFPDKRRRRFCCPEHARSYDLHYYWPAAARWCIERYGNRCAYCGVESGAINTKWCKDISHLECGKCGLRECPKIKLCAHHKTPLNGEKRTYNRLNHPDNLVASCLSHHVKRHAELRKETKGSLIPALPSRLPRNGHSAYLSNGEVAWLIGDKRLAQWYLGRVYLPPPGWFIAIYADVQGWGVGVCAELRRI